MKQFIFSSLFLCTLLFYSTPILSQEETQEGTAEPQYSYELVEEGTQSNTQEDKIHQVVDESPEFPGGTPELYKFIMLNLRYPQECIEKNIQGKVYASFVVEKDGSVSTVDIVRGVHPLLDQEAKRILSLMPKWNPGTIQGKEVRTKVVIPVSFKLN
jgi:periplasmic protein TonB